MRGGALVVLVWASLLLALFLGNWIYEGRAAQVAASAGSLGLVLSWGVLAALARGEALRSGPPPPRKIVHAVPDISFAAGLIGFSVATIAFGLVWGHFLQYFGGGLLLASLIRLWIELRAERQTLHAHRPPAPRESALRGSRPEQPNPPPHPPVERERPAP